MSKRHQYCSRKYDYSTLIESVLRSSYASSEQIFCFMCFVVQSCRLRLENGDIDRYPRSVEGGSSFVTSLTSRVLRRGGYEGFTEILDQAGIALLSAQIVENYCIQLSHFSGHVVGFWKLFHHRIFDGQENGLCWLPDDLVTMQHVGGFVGKRCLKSPNCHRHSQWMPMRFLSRLE